MIHLIISTNSANRTRISSNAQRKNLATSMLSLIRRKSWSKANIWIQKKKNEKKNDRTRSIKDVLEVQCTFMNREREITEQQWEHDQCPLSIKLYLKKKMYNVVFKFDWDSFFIFWPRLASPGHISWLILLGETFFKSFKSLNI